MTDTRVQKFAKILVEHSAHIQPGDRVLIEGTTAAEPLIRELFIQILEKGGHPHPLVALPGMMPFSQDEMYVTYAKDTQLDFVPTFYKLAYDQFEFAHPHPFGDEHARDRQRGPAQSPAARQGVKSHHRSADATRRRRRLQMGDDSVSNRSVCPGRRHERDGLFGFCFSCHSRT